MKKKGSTIILILIFIAGLGILAYPKVSDYWNSIHSSRAIMSYAEAVSGLSEEEYDRLYQEAEAYNRRIPERSNPFVPTEEEKAEYETILNVENDGVMGYIEIPTVPPRAFSRWPSAIWTGPPSRWGANPATR